MRSPILIHPTRRAQLAAVAQARGLSMAEVLDDMFRNEIAAGRMPDTMPGYEAITDDDVVFLTIAEELLPPVTRQIAGSIELTFAALADPASEGRARTIPLPEGYALKLGRHGRGVILAITDETGVARRTASMTPGIAKDFARIIRNALIV